MTQTARSSRPSSSPPYLLYLPSEIRELIYSFVIPQQLSVRRDFHLCECYVSLVSDSPVQQCRQCRASEEAVVATRAGLGLLGTCRFLYHEVQPLFAQKPVVLYGSGYHEQTLGFLNLPGPWGARQQLPDHVKRRVHTLHIGQASAFSCLTNIHWQKRAALHNFPFNDYPRLRTIEVQHRRSSGDPRFRGNPFLLPYKVYSAIERWILDRPAEQAGLTVLSVKLHELDPFTYADEECAHLERADAVIRARDLTIRYHTRVGYVSDTPVSAWEQLQNRVVNNGGGERWALDGRGAYPAYGSEYDCLIVWDRKGLHFHGLPDSQQANMDANLHASRGLAARPGSESPCHCWFSR